jgi:iron complex transport system substrate-binding protein
MKKKNKMVAMVEIAVVLCSVLVVALPAIAAEQTTQGVSTSTTATASEDDYVLGIYGNANEDDTIDMRDLTYVKLIFFGKKPETELADAKYDGKINPLDFIQIKLIIVGNEKELTIVDANGDMETIHKPVKCIVVEYMDAPELIRILNAEDKIVGVSSYIKQWNTALFPELRKLPGVGFPWRLDYEAVLNLHPDVLLAFMGRLTDEKKEKLPGVAVIFLGMYWPDLLNPEKSKPTDGIRKLGYILDKEEDAAEFANWRIGEINKIKSRIEGLSEDEKPRVFFSSPFGVWGTKQYETFTQMDTGTQMCTLAGGKSIAEELPEFVQTGVTIKVDTEWVIDQNPDFIFALVLLEHVAHGYGVDEPLEMAAAREDLLKRPELANVNAVKTGNVYIMAGNFRNDASCGVTGAAYMAKVFHPDLFEDLDPESIHQEYLEFQHFDYDLDEHGVFVYPPIEIDGGLAGIPDRYKGQI